MSSTLVFFNLGFRSIYHPKLILYQVIFNSYARVCFETINKRPLNAENYAYLILKYTLDFSLGVLRSVLLTENIMCHCNWLLQLIFDSSMN